MREVVIEPHPHPCIGPGNGCRMVIMGLTPGRQQADILKRVEASREGAFAGYMRAQLHDWFQQIGLVEELSLRTSDDLYRRPDLQTFLYTTSLLRDPVFVKFQHELKNYSGRNPKPWQNESLDISMQKTFYDLESLEPEALIFPLGKIVSEAIARFSNLDKRHFVMHGFPHPSGANGWRHSQFKNGKDLFQDIFKKWSDQRTFGRSS